MHINGIIITKEFISHRNHKRLRGSVGKAHIHISYMFLKSNEEIDFETQNQRSFLFNMFSLLSCLCVILQFIHISHLSKSLGFVRTTFSDSTLMRDNVLFDMPLSLLALSLYNLIMAQIVHYSWHLRVLLK